MKRTILFLMLLCAITIFGEESKEKPKKRSFFRLTEQDIILPIISIEWGNPDRLSITSRYIHDFHKVKKRITWRNNAGIFLSPGISGGRLGINYLGIYSPSSPKLRDFALFTELRGVLLRTWGKPLVTQKNTTFAGAEFKLCISFLLNATVGYYSPISDKEVDPFWGFHFGIGI